MSATPPGRMVRPAPTRGVARSARSPLATVRHRSAVKKLVRQGVRLLGSPAPEDSQEAELYRAKDPTALDALKDWLEAELKKAP